MPTSIAITPEEHCARCHLLLERTQIAGLAGVVLFDPTYVLYYTGFAFVPTERPIACVLAGDGTRALVVPRLEVEHAESRSTLDRVEHYLEYPGDPRADDVLRATFADMGLAGTIGADQDGYPWILGYRGPTLSELSGAEVVRVVEEIEAQMAIKSEAEITLIRESVRWGNLAHRLLQRYTRVGVTETEVSQRASDEATFAMLDAIGEIYRAQSAFSSGAHAGYRGQIGRNSAIPHALAGNLVFQAGDVLVTGASAPSGVPVGAGADDVRRRAESTAGADVRAHGRAPGHRVRHDPPRRCLLRRRQGGPPTTTRTTSGRTGATTQGMRSACATTRGPFLDSGDHTEIRPGMVFTVEPGLYSPELGGFRHSDTVLVTEDGIEILTYYPRDLASLVISA